MSDLPALLRVRACGGEHCAVLRAQPSPSAADVGEVPAEVELPPLGRSPDGLWWAVAWDGGTAWLSSTAASAVEPVGTDGAGAAPATAFHWPIGSTGQRADTDVPAGWYVAVGFNEVYQPSLRRQAIHPGLDLNLRSGGDTDLGQPVFAAADGEVTASGAWPVWGNIVVVRHRLPDGGQLWSQYAHLARRLVVVGNVVRRGQQIGTIGKGERRQFAAHLHFEIRQRDVPASFWPGLDRQAVLSNYLDPVAVVGASGAATIRRTPSLLGAVDAPPHVVAAMRDAGGGWVGRTVPLGTRGTPRPLPEMEDDGVRCVLHLTPGGSEAAGNWALTPAFARAAAAFIRELPGRPWAILLGGDWDETIGAPSAARAPAHAAAAYNLAADRVRQALADTGRPDVRVGPGPLSRRRDGADPVGFWQRMLDEVSTVDVLAVPAWTHGEDPRHVPAPPELESGRTPVGDGLHRYWRLLAAVPDQWRSRPALLYGLDPTEPRRGGRTGWLAAVTADVRRWNASHWGPSVRGVLVAEWSASDTPLLSSNDPPLTDLPPTDPTGYRTLPTGDAWRRTWQGKGLLVATPWPLGGLDPASVVRSWRAAGLSFVALRVSATPPGMGGAVASAQALVAAARRPGTVAVWGWSQLRGHAPAVEAAAIGGTAGRLGVCGWILEAAAGADATQVGATLERLRLDLGMRPLGLTWPPETPAELVDRLASLVDVLLPQVRRAGAVGPALAGLVRFGRPVVPVLVSDQARAEELAQFLSHSQAIELPGAALLVAESSMGSGDTRLADALRDTDWSMPTSEKSAPKLEGVTADV